MKSPPVYMSFPLSSNVSDVRLFLRHPFTMVISGPSGCGKTTFVEHLIDRADIGCFPPPNRILFYHSMEQRAYDSIKFKHPDLVQFIKGMPPSADDLASDPSFNRDEPKWIIIDDQMDVADKSPELTTLFTKGSHHLNVSLIFITQNFFSDSRQHRTNMRNAHYLVIFKNPSDKLMITRIGSKMFPGKTHKFVKEFEDATREPFSYIFIDNRQETPDQYRILSNVLGERGEWVRVHDIK